jgi:hypothetical protein
VKVSLPSEKFPLISDSTAQAALPTHRRTLANERPTSNQAGAHPDLSSLGPSLFGTPMAGQPFRLGSIRASLNGKWSHRLFVFDQRVAILDKNRVAN